MQDHIEDQDQEFLSMEVLAPILKEYDWPAAYTFDDDSPGGIIMRFPKCSIMIVEGYLSNMQMYFLPEDTHYDYNLTLGHALLALIPERERGPGPLTPGLIEDLSIYGSLEKVQNGIRDLCTILLYHLKPCILGDFSWVVKYKAMMDAKSNA